MSIEQLSRSTGVTVDNLRRYEFHSLIPPPQRTANGYQVYDSSILERIAFIERTRGLGFSIAEIGDLLRLQSDSDDVCAAVKALAHAKLADIEKKIKDMQAMRILLTKFEQECERNEDREKCPFLSSLNENANCCGAEH